MNTVQLVILVIVGGWVLLAAGIIILLGRIARNGKREHAARLAQAQHMSADEAWEVLDRAERDAQASELWAQGQRNRRNELITDIDVELLQHTRERMHREGDLS